MKKLFEEWEKYQLQVIEENKPVFSQDICPESFSPDGIICEESYINANTRVLFICKESNISSSLDDGKLCADRSFWLQDVLIDSKKTNRAGSRFINGLSVLYNAVKNYPSEKVDTDNDSLKEVAFINLNKMGGTNKSNYTIIKNYVDSFKKYIIEQIELINPYLIVCCSQDVKKIVDECKLAGNRKTVQVNHPSFFKESYKDKIENMIKELEKIGYKTQTEHSSTENS